MRPAPKPARLKAKPTAVVATVVAAPPFRSSGFRPRRIWRLRVGLFTADLVGTLILFGLYPNALGQAWDIARRLIGL